MNELFKRVFSRKAPENISKSIRVPTTMWAAIEYLAKEYGESPNGYVVLVLDQFLQAKLENGKIPSSIISPDEKTAV